MRTLLTHLQLLIVPHEAMEKNLRYPFEVLFRSMMVRTLTLKYELCCGLCVLCRIMHMRSMGA